MLRPPPSSPRPDTLLPSPTPFLSLAPAAAAAALAGASSSPRCAAIAPAACPSSDCPSHPLRWATSRFHPPSHDCAAVHAGFQAPPRRRAWLEPPTATPAAAATAHRRAALTSNEERLAGKVSVRTGIYRAAP